MKIARVGRVESVDTGDIFITFSRSARIQPPAVPRSDATRIQAASAGILSAQQEIPLQQITVTA